MKLRLNRNIVVQEVPVMTRLRGRIGKALSALVYLRSCRSIE
jgi:hypothetical protein